MAHWIFQAVFATSLVGNVWMISLGGRLGLGVVLLSRGVAEDEQAQEHADGQVSESALVAHDDNTSWLDGPPSWQSIYLPRGYSQYMEVRRDSAPLIFTSRPGKVKRLYFYKVKRLYLIEDPCQPGNFMAEKTNWPSLPRCWAGCVPGSSAK